MHRNLTRKLVAAKVPTVACLGALLIGTIAVSTGCDVRRKPQRQRKAAQQSRGSAPAEVRQETPPSEPGVFDTLGSPDTIDPSALEEKPSVFEQPADPVELLLSGESDSAAVSETVEPPPTPSPTPEAVSPEALYEEFQRLQEEVVSAGPVVEPITETLKAVARAWDGKRAIKVPQGRLQIEGDSWPDWSNNYIGALVDFSTVRLNFKRSPDAKEGAEESTNEFSLSLDFGERRIVVDKGIIQKGPVREVQEFRSGNSLTLTHSRPKRTNLNRGIRVALGGNQTSAVYFPGLGGSSVVVLAPKQPRNGVRGVLVCNREFQLWEVTQGRNKLRETPYELTSVEFGPDVILDTKVATGSGEGVAQVKVQVSDGVVQPTKGGAYRAGVYPRASLAFLPQPKSFKKVAFSGEAIQEQLMAQTRLINSEFQEVKSTVRAVIGVAPVRVGQEVQVPIDGERFSFSPGECLAVAKRWKTVHSFGIGEVSPVVKLYREAVAK